MGKGCLNVSKYLLFIFNIILFLFGVAIMGLGLWLLMDKQSFVAVLNNSASVSVGCYILIGVGAFSMLMGFTGCVGAVYELRCMLGLYIACLILILLAQIVAVALIYIQRGKLNEEMSGIVDELLERYPGNNTSVMQVWDYIQKNMKCCGWNDDSDWDKNPMIQNGTEFQFACSCLNASLAADDMADSGFCVAPSASRPVYKTGCAESVNNWLATNVGMVVGVCLGVAFIELLGMLLSVCMWRNLQEDYSKVPASF